MTRLSMTRLSWWRALAVLVPLVLFAVEVATMARWEWYDARVAGWARTLVGCQAWKVVSTLSDCEAWLGAVFVGVAAVSAWRHGLDVRRLALMLAALGIALTLAPVLKTLLERPRPGALPWDHAGGSFPSAHVMNAALTMLAGATILDAAPGARGSRRLVWGAGALFVVTMMWTRVYLGRHWPTDVVGSVLLAPGVWWLAQPPLDARRPVLRVAAAGAFTGALGLAVVAGARLPLGSPASLTPTVAAGDVAFAPGASARLPFVLPDAGRVLVKAVISPATSGPRETCRWVSMLIDGERIGVRPLRQRWQTVAFAVPWLAPGPHVVELTEAIEARQTRGVRVNVFALQVERGGACLARSRSVALPQLDASAGYPSSSATALKMPRAMTDFSARARCA